MGKESCEFDDFIVATVLADLFDPDESNDLDIIAKRIVEGLSRNGLISSTKGSFSEYSTKNNSFKNRFNKESNNQIKAA